MNNYWRTLEEFADTEEFREFIRREYSSQVDIALDPVSRRRFLKLMGASLALAGIAGCARAPTETIVPYVRQPEEIVPGQPLYFATAMPLAGLATGLLVESHMGRPTKVEGNPLHPASLGATDVYAQASVLDLWDPARAQTPTYGGKIRPWDAFVVALRAVLEQEKQNSRPGLENPHRRRQLTDFSRAVARAFKRVPGGKMASMGTRRLPPYPRRRSARLR